MIEIANLLIMIQKLFQKAFDNYTLPLSLSFIKLDYYSYIMRYCNFLHNQLRCNYTFVIAMGKQKQNCTEAMRSLIQLLSILI